MAANGNEPKRTISDDDLAAKLFAKWAESQVSSFTAEEVKELRAIIELRKRLAWVTSSLKTWAVWVAAIVAGYTVLGETLSRAVKTLGK